MKRTLLIVLTTFFMSNICSYAQFPDDTLWTRFLGWDVRLVTSDFSSDESKVIAIAEEKIMILDTETGTLLKTSQFPFNQYGKVRDAIISKTDNRVFLICDSLDYMWDWNNDNMLWSFTETYKHKYFLPPFLWDNSTNKLYFIEPDSINPRIKIYNDSNGNLINTMNIDSYVLCESAYKKLSKNGRYMALTGSAYHYFRVVVWDLETGMEYQLEKSDEPITHLAFTSDNNYLATADVNGIVNIYDLNVDETNHWLGNTKHLVMEINLGSGTMNICFSQNGKYLFFYGADMLGKIKLYDIVNERIQHLYNIYAPININVNISDEMFVACNNIDVYLVKTRYKETSIIQPHKKNTLYPNPSTNIVNIKLEQLSLEPINISIYDEMGSLVTTIFDGISNQTDFVWNTEAVPSGVYFCKIDRHSGITTTKIIVAR